MASFHSILFKRRSKLFRLVATCVALLIAGLLQYWLAPLLKTGIYPFFYLAVIFSTVVGEGLLALLISTVAGQAIFYVLSPSTWSLNQEIFRSGVFFVIASASLLLTKRLYETAKKSELGEMLANIEREQFSKVVQSALDGFVGMDEQGLVTHWNRQSEIIFGFTHAEIIGKRLSETIIPQSYREAHERGMRHYLASGEGPVLNKRIEITAVKKDGSEIDVELAITPIQLFNQRYFAAFLRDISDAKALQKSLHEKISELEKVQSALAASLQDKDEFLSFVAHELRTPLTSLSLQIQLSEKLFLNKSDTQDFAQKVKQIVSRESKQVDTIARLVDDILDMARAEGKKLGLNLETFDLCALVSEVVERHLPQYEKENVPILYDCPSPLVGEWDRFRIEQVITNLLTNALRYGKKLPVEVSLKKLGTYAVLEVKDHGVGIAKENQERIFKRFERIGDSKTIRGLGLGLYILREIVELHQGKVEVTSELGLGSTFRVFLPLSSPSNSS